LVDEQPPADAESWTDEQWIAWLKATDADVPDDRPHPVKQHSTPSSLLGAAMLGMHEAIYGHHEKDILVVADDSGEPPQPDGLDLHIDPEHPEVTVVVVHPPPETEPSD
jgi:hypothetical protein